VQVLPSLWGSRLSLALATVERESMQAGVRGEGIGGRREGRKKGREGRREGRQEGDDRGSE
jgi:hypothetical protein